MTYRELTYVISQRTLSNPIERKKVFREIIEEIKGEHLMSHSILRRLNDPTNVLFKLVLGKEEHGCQHIKNDIIYKQGGVVNDKMVWDSTCTLPQ